MTDVSCRGRKRKMAASIFPVEPSSEVTYLSSSLLLLEIPADTNTSLPVWEAIRSQQVDITWTVNPYSISVHVTPVTSKQEKSAASGKSESASGAARASVLPSSILQPQMVIQSIAQQHGSSQDTSCVLLTFSQSAQSLSCPPSDPQKIALNCNPASSLIVPLPLIITQPQPAHQPGTPTKKGALPFIETPTSTPTKLETPSKEAVFSPFHIKSSSDIQICDDFLLGSCHAGKACKMHHTPYPFHWQLWCSITHQWVNIPLPSQVLLERIYCNVNQETICLKDGPASYTLNFDLMELDDPARYDGIRRLTNSNRNPHFPSQWKIYWWDNFSWKEYNKDVSALLLNKMNIKAPGCSFYINSQEYRVDFTDMRQTNVTTGFQREVRCRPVYRSPESMQSYLQSVSWIWFFVLSPFVFVSFTNSAAEVKNPGV